MWSLGFGGLHLGPRWSRSEPVEGVEVQATSWQSQHGFRPLLRPSGDLRFDWGIAPSHVFLIMALQRPADHKAWQRGRCAPSETGLNIHQRPFFALAPVCQLGAHPQLQLQAATTFWSKLAGALGIAVQPPRPPLPQCEPPEPGPTGDRVWRRAGWLVTAVHRQKHRRMATLAAALTSSFKELITDFLVLLSNCLRIAFLRAVN